MYNLVNTYIENMHYHILIKFLNVPKYVKNGEKATAQIAEEWMTDQCLNKSAEVVLWMT